MVVMIIHSRQAATTIGMSRIVKQKHYTHDVLVGALLGTTVAFILSELGKKPRKSPLNLEPEPPVSESSENNAKSEHYPKANKQFQKFFTEHWKIKNITKHIARQKVAVTA